MMELKLLKGKIGQNLLNSPLIQGIYGIFHLYCCSFNHIDVTVPAQFDNGGRS